MSNLKPIIEESFKQYAGAVIQSRALVDVRDGLKPSARQIFYALYDDKFLPSKPYKKTLKAVGSLSRFYIHGDSSAVGVLMRAAQSFAMRYPLIDVHGGCGNLLESGNWAHQRYTESRLSYIGEGMFTDITKDTIAEWRDNYDNTEQYPSVLPSKGFYNICNGTLGIAIGAASSIPQYNLKEMNKALEYLLLNPNCSFEDIYCAPDFATGGILYNEEEVKESMKNGTGYACKLRSVVEYDSKERALIVTEIPYNVYTNTICEQLTDILEENEKKGLKNPGIDRFNDLTNRTPLIKIYLTKTASPEKVLRYLFKNTSLQDYYGINFTMLDKGRFPKVFTWKEMLQAHIDHEKEVYRRGFEFDLRKIKERLHIVEALLKAYAAIDQVIQTIRSAANTQIANIELQKLLNIDEIQAKAILDLKLSKLSKLDVNKLNTENDELVKERDRIEKILNDTNLFNQELINGWREVASKYGDERRTEILNLKTTEDDEVVEVKSLQVSLTNQNNLFASEVSSLYTQKRGGVGTKIKLAQNEYITTSTKIETNEELLLFTNEGNYYHIPASQIALNQLVSAYALFSIKDTETICTISSLSKKEGKDYLLFVTKYGIGKKSALTEYNIKKGNGSRALTLDNGDELAAVMSVNKDDTIGILTCQGNFLLIRASEIRETGRITRGVTAIKLNEDDYVISARPIPEGTKDIISITGNGYFKKTPYTEFSTQSRATKGAKIQKFGESDWIADFVPSKEKSDLIIASTRSIIKLTTDDVPSLSRGAQGNKSVKLNQIDNIIKISLC